MLSWCSWVEGIESGEIRKMAEGIDPMLSAVVTTYVDEALAQLRRLGLMRSPVAVSPAMQDRSVASSGNGSAWTPIPSEVSDADLDELEAESGIKYPPLYRDFLRYRHFVELTSLGIAFRRHLPGTWRETLRSSYFQEWRRERIVDVGLLPFATETLAEAGPVCFDTRVRSGGGDCPVVFWDHEWVDTDREVRPMFSSTRKMFECLTLVAQTDFDFFDASSRDDAQRTEEKRDKLRMFLALDPFGAGGNARTYWTRWGVRIDQGG